MTPEQLARTGSETAHQRALFAWAALNRAKYPCLKYMFAIPNGGERNIKVAAGLKAEGVKSGVPDIFLPAPGWGKHGLFIEMKKEMYRNRKNGGCSDEQLGYIEYLSGCGYTVRVCYNWIEASEVIVNYLEGRL